MYQRPNSWKVPEEDRLVELILENARQGNKVSVALEKASEELQRSFGSCRFQWYGNLKDAYQEDFDRAVDEGGKLTMTDDTIRPLDTWRNIKHGTFYGVRGLSKHSETDEEMVEYTQLATGDKYVRPKALFLEKFTLHRRSPYARNN